MFPRILSLFLALSTPALAERVNIDGPSVGSGGNGLEAEFSQMARYFGRYVDENVGIATLNVPAGGLLKYVNSVKVKAVRGPLECEGEKKDACSDGSKRETLLDDATWGTRTLMRRYQNVIHELMRLLNVEDPNYAFSEELASLTFPGFVNWQKQQPDPARAKEFFPPKNGINVVSTNFDGSITIKNPRLMFEGQLRRVATGAEDKQNGFGLDKRVESVDSAIGVCAIFGKSKLVTHLSATSSEFGTAIKLTKEGGFAGRVIGKGHNVLEGFWTTYIIQLNSVTCK